MDKLRFKARLVLWSAVALNILIGILYIWSIISKALINDLGWTSKQASLPYTLVTISFTSFMVVFGRIQDIKGPRMPATLSGILLGGGLILCCYFLTPVGLLIAFGIITGAGIGIAYVSTAPAAVKWFPPEKKGMITGTVVAGIGISAIVYAPIAEVLIRNVGIEKTFLYLGIGALVLMVLFAQAMNNPPPGYIPESTIANREKKRAAPATFARDVEWREMFKDISFYKLWIMYAFSTAAGLMIIAHAAKIAEVQIGWEGGVYLVILLAVFNAAGRFLGGAISDKIGRLNLMRIAFMLQAINMLVFSFYFNIPLLAIGMSVAGLCYGACFSVFPPTVIDMYGIKNYGTNYGLIMMGWGIGGGIIGPMMAAAIFDAYKSYTMAYFVACALLIAVFILTFTFKGTALVRK
ncbi:MAG: OFA family MFS transporter [Firmicutes bacterium]|nr:OFA family MFS transporter [Bacillota bacterium]